MAAARYEGSWGSRFGTLLFVALALILVYGLLRPGGCLEVPLPAPRLPGDPPELQMVYDWQLGGMNVPDLDAAETRGRAVFLNLWATWCGPCRMEMPAIERLYLKLKDEDVAFLIVSHEDPREVRQYVEEEGFRMPVYAGMWPGPFVEHTEAIPTTFIIAPDGRVVARHVGAAAWDDDSVVQFIRGLIRPAEPEGPAGRAG